MITLVGSIPPPPTLLLVLVVYTCTHVICGCVSTNVHVRSDPGVYLSLNNVIIPNHGYVVISDIGSTDDTALICHTNRPPPDNGPHSGGDWFAPDNSRVGEPGIVVPGFRRNRGPMMVRLLRDTATDPPSEGIYHCQIMAAEETILTFVYVGLYNSGGGINVYYSNKVNL